MIFNEEDKILIKNLYVYKEYSARQLIGDLPEKGRKLRNLNYLLKKLRETDSTDRKRSGRPRTARTPHNMAAVDDQRRTYILNICCNVFVVHCWLTVIF